jgi:hypothetical protein
MSNPFKIIDWLTSKTKPDDVETPKDGYNSFIINRHFSYFPDLIFFANEMNKSQNFSSDIDMQFGFYDGILKKQKRFAKWAKTTKNPDIAIIMEYYGYSVNKSKQVIGILTSTQIKEIAKELQKGGQGNTKKLNK